LSPSAETSNFVAASRAEELEYELKLKLLDELDELYDALE
jgi:hypothetical protein